MLEIINYPKDKNKLLKKITVDSFNNLSFQKKVIDIIEDVKKNKDQAIIKYNEKFDGAKLTSLKVSSKEINQAQVSPELALALKTAIKNIKDFHKKQILKDIHFKGKYGEILKQIFTPMEKAGVYVPGGRGGTTPLISTLLMNVIPAQLAGVKQITISTPPQKDGSLSPTLLYGLKLLKLTNVFKCGGSQAIAALTYGTQSIPANDIIVGPGNEWVTYAKKIVYGDTMIDGLNGNSEIVILSDGREKPDYLAADLLSQAEHAGSELTLLITDKKEHALAVINQVKSQIKKLSRKNLIEKSLRERGAVILLKDLKISYDLINLIAPEHLELHIKNNLMALKKIKNAGAIFLGKYSSEPIGDYICGTNHVLPTGQTARFASPLGVYTFLKRTNIIKYNQAAFKNYAGLAFTLAQSEGLDAHAQALDIRLKKNNGHHD